MIESIKNRATIRRYSSKEVPNNLLYNLLETAERTQTMGNLQLYSVIITRDEAMKTKLAPAHFNQPMVTQAPVILTVCADFRRTTAWAEQRDAAPGYSNFLSFLNAATDALLYTQTFCDLAESEGLGYCFLGTTIYMPQMIIDTLKLPKLVMPIATLTLGYPDEKPAKTDRLPIESIIHNETYHDYTPAQIDEYYAYKEGLEESKRFCKENQKATLAQVFTDVRYTKKDNETMSATMLNALKAQGFL